MIQTDEEFGKDFLIAGASPAERDSWMEAIMAAKNNQPLPDSIRPVYAVRNEGDTYEGAFVGVVSCCVGSDRIRSGRVVSCRVVSCRAGDAVASCRVMWVVLLRRRPTARRHPVS